MNKKHWELDAAVLRWFALACMLLDHLWGTIVPGNDWMTYLGRLAFPIFAFQISEGYIHTHDFGKYSRRLLLFAVISEIPFDLMMASTIFYPFHQNVMFTLWLGLMSIRVIDLVKSCKTKQWIGCLQLLGLYLLGYITFPDYGLLGVLNVTAFYLLRDFRGARLAQLAAMIAIHAFGFHGEVFPFYILGFSVELPAQTFAVFSLLPIWLYNGQKGSHNRYLQYFSYVFYPLHMLVLHYLLILL